MVTRDDVVFLAIALFGETGAPQVLALLSEYGQEAHEPEINRVHLAILQVSEGKSTRLPYFVKCAKIDYRDVLTGARLPPMSEAEEAAWQAAADRRLAGWNRR